MSKAKLIRKLLLAGAGSGLFCKGCDCTSASYGYTGQEYKLNAEERTSLEAKSLDTKIENDIFDNTKQI